MDIRAHYREKFIVNASQLTLKFVGCSLIFQNMLF